VSPVDIQEEMKQYYCKLLGLKSAVEASDPEKVGDMTERFTIIVPDALNKFPVSFLNSFCRGIYNQRLTPDKDICSYA